MKFVSAIYLITLLGMTAEGQSNFSTSTIDTALAKRITISGFCLCETTLQQLQAIDRDLKKVEVEEMDSPKNCFGQDSRFENGKGYYSNKFAGIVFQKDQITDHISKIRLTKDFRGSLPDGIFIDVKNLKLKDIFLLYPSLKDKWGSRGCSNYWSFSNDTLLFYVKIDSAKKPQFPIDEAYYYDKAIEAVDLVVSCYSIFERATNKYMKKWIQ
jgi:hypothetical protein